MAGETSSPQGAHPSRFMLARSLAGGLDAGMEKEFHDHLRGCGECGREYSLARQCAEEFLSVHPEWELLRRARPERQSAREVTSTLRRLGLLGEWLSPGWRVALGCLPFLACLWYLGLANRAPQSDLTAKGEARFRLFVNGARVAADTLECLPYDTLQLGLVSAGPMHYAVMYRDDGGSIGSYMESGKSQPLGRPGGQNLPHSLVLQEGWKDETLYCLWSPRPFGLAEAEARIDSKQRTADAKLHVQTFHLVNGRL